jgi:hypothetical protein
MASPLCDETVGKAVAVAAEKVRFKPTTAICQ